MKKSYANKWWHNAVIYQIYPRSFYDSNGDGIGDIQGIIAKIPYLKDLGVSAVWICPMFASPNVDNGYDVSDYKQIDPSFGTMHDMQELIAVAHAVDIKIIMDMVANHTSNQHSWFLKASTGDAHYKDYYIWEPNLGKIPNNWGSFFGGSAWSLHNKLNEYYLHLFTPEQPDLNWSNPSLRNEIYDIMNYWGALGVDGWRLDAISHIAKPKKLQNYNSTIEYVIGKEHGNGEHLHEYLAQMHAKVFAHNPNSISIGEANLIPMEEAHLFVDQERKELDMMFTFDHMDCDRMSSVERDNYHMGTFNLAKLKDALGKWQHALYEKGWNALYLNNHDQARSVSRFCSDTTYWQVSAKMLGLLLHGMQGTPFIYQGEEIGMTNTKLDLADIDDKAVHQRHKDLVLQRKLMSNQEFQQVLNQYAREHSRTPMQWSNQPNAGFSVAKPWLAVNSNYPQINVQAQYHSSDSIYAFYKELIALRNPSSTIKDIITYGSFNFVNKDHPNVFAYSRNYGDKILLVICSFADSNLEFKVPQELILHGSAKMILNNYSQGSDVITKILPQVVALSPYQGVMYLLEKM